MECDRSNDHILTSMGDNYRMLFRIHVNSTSSTSTFLGDGMILVLSQCIENRKSKFNGRLLWNEQTDTHEKYVLHIYPSL